MIPRLVLPYRVTRFHIRGTVFRFLNLAADISFFAVLQRLQLHVANCHLCGMSKNTRDSYINTFTADPLLGFSYRNNALESILYDSYRYEANFKPPVKGGQRKPTSISAFLSVFLSLM